MKILQSITGSLLLKDGTIYDPATGKSSMGSVLIKDGVVEEILSNGKLVSADKIINCHGKVITCGFTDIHVHFREPGREDKETLETGSLAALAGGFTRVCVMPNTNPVLDTPESIRFILDRAKKLPVEICPIGAITKGQGGTELAEMGEMIKAGAVAVSDDGLPVVNGQMMKIAVEYAGQFGVPVINHAEDVLIRSDGVMNEGSLSTRLGLSGNPDISESVMVYRDLVIAEYVSGKIHVPHVSTAKSVELIRRFKKKGLDVTAEVTPHHIGLNENKLAKYDTNAKVAPPLRTDGDRIALIEALKDGTIDCIATDHAPHTIEEKESDFNHAPCGMIGLESAFGMVHSTLTEHGFDIFRIIDLLTVNPARVMGFEVIPITKGKKANFTVIDPTGKWTFKKSDIHSRSKNSPMLGMEFEGKVLTTILGNNIFS
jgi:dihydroorotase